MFKSPEYTSGQVVSQEEGSFPEKWPKGIILFVIWVEFRKLIKLIKTAGKYLKNIRAFPIWECQNVLRNNRFRLRAIRRF